MTITHTPRVPTAPASGAQRWLIAVALVLIIGSAGIWTLRAVGATDATTWREVARCTGGGPGPVRAATASAYPTALVSTDVCNGHLVAEAAPAAGDVVVSFLVSAGAGQTAVVQGISDSGGTLKIHYSAIPAPASGAHSSIAYTSTVFIAFARDALPALPFKVEDFGGPVVVANIAS